MRLYYQIAKVSFQENFAYPTELIARILKEIVRLLFRILFWGVVAINFSELYTLKTIIAYYLIISSLSSLFHLTTMQIAIDIGNAVRFGKINEIICKPLDISWTVAARRYGRNGVSLVISIILITAGVILAGVTSIYPIIHLVLIALVGIVISFSLNKIVGALSFVFIEISEIAWSIRHVIKLLSGFIIPLDLFPLAFQRILIFLPFSVVYWPAKVIIDPISNVEFIKLFLILISWAVLLWIVSSVIWKALLKRYDAVGI